MSNESENKMSNERIDIELMESRIRLWREGDISDEALALEMDYMVPELKRCYERIDRVNESMKVTRERVLNNTEDWNNALFQEVIDALLLLD